MSASATPSASLATYSVVRNPVGYSALTLPGYTHVVVPSSGVPVVAINCSLLLSARDRNGWVLALTLTALVFEPQSGTASLTLYNGATAAAPVLVTHSTHSFVAGLGLGAIPETFTASGPDLLVEIVSSPSPGVAGSLAPPPLSFAAAPTLVRLGPLAPPNKSRGGSGAAAIAGAASAGTVVVVLAVVVVVVVRCVRARRAVKGEAPGAGKGQVEMVARSDDSTFSFEGFVPSALAHSGLKREGGGAPGSSGASEGAVSAPSYSGGGYDQGEQGPVYYDPYATSTSVPARWGNAVSAAQAGAGGGPFAPSAPPALGAALVQYDGDEVRRQCALQPPSATGAFGMVYHVVLRGREVAVKAFAHLAVVASTAASTVSFQRELQALGTVRHKNIVVLLGYAMGSDGTSLWLVYEWMPGGDLAHALGLGASNALAASLATSLTLPQRVQICIDVVDALAFCHRGCDGALTGYILHRDVKPDNVLLGTAPDEGGGRLIAKLADFGVSKLVGGDGNAGGLTNVTGGIAFGTPGYIDPQVSEGVVTTPTPAVDVYSLGIVILQVATGLPVRFSQGGVAREVHIRKALSNARKMATGTAGDSLCSASLVHWTHPHVLRELISVGLDCSEHEGSARPALPDVKRALLRCQALLDVAPTGKQGGGGVGAQAPGRECDVCLERPKCVRFTSCGHMVCCAECADALRPKLCPTCRSAFTTYVSVGFSEPTFRG